MKNNFKKTSVFIVIFLLIFNNNILNSEEFTYETSEIEILDNGNIIKALNGVTIKTNSNIIIKAQTSTYNKKNRLLELNGNILIVDKINNITATTQQVFYSELENKIFSTTQTNFKFNNKYFAEMDNFNYFIKAKYIASKNKVKIEDELGGIFVIQDFKYQIDKNIFRGRNTKYTDTEKNEYLISDTMINLTTNEVFGKDLSINFDKKTFNNLQNDPRLKAKSLIVNDDSASMSKGVFTTCKKNDKCPPWAIYAENIEHDKSKKIIKYKNAWLKLYDVPIVYFPKFSHPDPTVKRQSGFLTPGFSNSSNIGLSLDIPYYKVISDNKDLTFTPRLYFNDQLILQTEYRQANKANNHVVDFSVNNSDYASGINNTKSHFFSNSNIDLKMNNFNSSKLEFNVETTTNDTYLKTYKINSPLIKDTTTLNSYINFEAEKEDLSFTTSIEVYEDLSKNSNDRFEYIYPNYKLIKKIDTNRNFNNDLIFSSYGYQKKYATNVYEGTIINDLLYDPVTNFNKNGFKSKFNALLKNVNIEAKNSTKQKNKFDQSLLASVQYQSEYPLKKNGNIFDGHLIPKVSFMYSPNKTKNMLEDDRRIDINNVFSMERLAADDTIEGGSSITIGAEYKKINNKSYKEILNINLAQVIRSKKNEDLPINSGIGNTSSDIFGNFNFNPNSFFDIEYNFAIDNNFNETNYDSIKTEFTVNNFVTTFEFLDDKKGLKQKSYISNNSTLNFDGTNALGFNIRKNRKTNATEFYDLIYSYTNDCLVASIKYNKDYYTNADLKPEEQIFLSLTIIPFGKVDSINVN